MILGAESSPPCARLHISAGPDLPAARHHQSNLGDIFTTAKCFQSYLPRMHARSPEATVSPPNQSQKATDLQPSSHSRRSSTAWFQLGLPACRTMLFARLSIHKVSQNGCAASDCALSRQFHLAQPLDKGIISARTLGCSSSTYQGSWVRYSLIWCL